MTTDLNLNDTTPIKTGTLASSGEAYTLVRLGEKNIDQIMALQDIAFADLDEDQGHWVIYKPRAFFEEHFKNDGLVLGIVAGGKLIAQSAIVNPTAARPKTGMTDMPALANVDLARVTIQQNVIVDPAARGNRLMGIMVQEWLDAALKAGRTEAISEVASDNPASWNTYLKSGLHIESLGTDPNDGTHVYNMHGHIPALAKIFNAAAATRAVVLADIETQKELVEKGYKGVSYEPAAGKVTYAPAAPCI